MTVETKDVGFFEENGFPARRHACPHRRAISMRIQGIQAMISPALKARYEEFRAYNRAPSA